MRVRYHISNNATFAEFPKTEQGLEQAKIFRAANSEFKHRRITEVIQAYPERIPLGVSVKLT